MGVQENRIQLLIMLPAVLWDRTWDSSSVSPALTDKEEFGGRALFLITEVSKISLKQCIDHMEGLARVLEAQPPLMFSAWALARAALEAVARAAWILDPQDTAKGKASKALLLSIKDQQWKKKWLDMNQEPEDMDSFRKIQNEERKLFLDIAKEIGTNVDFSRQDNVRNVGTATSMSQKDLVESVLELEGLYTILSEHVHATLNAEYFVRESGMDEMVNTIYHISRWFAQASWWYFEYFGVDCSRIIPVLDRIWRHAEFPDEARCWHRGR